MSNQSGTVRALIVGIDNYKNTDTVPPLAGAVADARDIDRALRRAGVSDITLLLDQDARRERLEAAFSALSQRTQPLDLVIVTFAGHGSQDREHHSATEPDGKDEFFVLWGFGNKGTDTKERLIDDEMFGWLGKLASGGTRTIFLADTCHGGGLSKAPDNMTGRAHARFLYPASSAAEAGRGAYFIAPGDDELVPSLVSSDDDATRSHPSLTFLAGADAQTSVLEVPISGQERPRGAASFAFARALEGEADRGADRNGVTTRAELMTYLYREIGQLTQNRQAFVFEPRDLPSASFALFSNSGARIAPIGLPVQPERAAIADGGGSEGGIDQPAIGVTVAAAPPAPLLTHVFIDETSGNIVSRKSGVLAYGVPPDEIAAATERFEAEERFAHMQLKQPLNMTMTPSTRTYVEGDSFAISASGLFGRHLVIFNLTGSGRLQYVFPRGDAQSMQNHDVTNFAMEAQAPFGSDALVVIAAKNRPRRLEAELLDLDGKPASLKAWETVERHLGADDRLAVIPYKTRPRSVHSAK